MKEYVGDFYKVVSTGDVIYIGSDLPSEYSGSAYTKKLNGAAAKAKANAAQGLPEMIEILERTMKINMPGMQEMAGIDIILILHCRYMVITKL